MHPNEKLIHDFYDAFAKLDADGMARCYHPDAQFTDPAFPLLKGPEVMGMWRMLVSRAKDFSLTHDQVSANDQDGRAHWEAKYTFSKTGRSVHNRIDAMFAFKDGLIIRHIDRFSFWRWAAQALGPVGLVAGWFPPLKWTVRKQARAGLDQYMDRQS